MKFSQEHPIQYYECDATGSLTLPMLLNIIIQTSEAQSDSLDRGTNYVNNLGFTWVITEHDMKITKLPETNQMVRVTTQAKEYNKYFCYRHFWLHDLAGNELIKIETTFVLMNMETRKMVSVPNDLIEPYKSQKIKTIKRSERISGFTDVKKKEYYVRFSDIDTNHHVNNSRYLEWMTDSMSFDFLMNYVPKKVLIRFSKEISYGQKVTSVWQKEAGDDSQEVITKHQIDVDDLKCAEGRIVWQKNEQINR